jgi:hypothetical protein
MYFIFSLLFLFVNNRLLMYAKAFEEERLEIGLKFIKK